MHIEICDGLRRNIVGVSGDKGAAWLEGLPLHLATLERSWRIRVEAPFPMLSYNYVAPATCEDGRRVVLKTGVPSSDLNREMAALRFYAGRGSVRLLRSSQRMGAMLLERLEPGTMAVDLEDDDESTRIAARCMTELWQPLAPDHKYYRVCRWADGLGKLRQQFDGGTGPLPATTVERAEGLFRDLFASATETVLLHGDLHHYNVLRDATGWRVIDPKGVAGDPAYECGAWLRNPFNFLYRPNVTEALARRIAIFSEMLGFERERIRDWAFAQSVLCAWWDIEDGGDGWEESLVMADCIARAVG